MHIQDGVQDGGQIQKNIHKYLFYLSSNCWNLYLQNLTHMCNIWNQL